MSNKLLIQESPLIVLPSLAVEIGLNEAIFAQQLQFWLHMAGKSPELPRWAKQDDDGLLWIRSGFDQWKRDNFPFWHVDTIRRIVGRCEKKGIVRSSATMNENPFDQTKWYTISPRFVKLQSDDGSDSQSDLGSGSESDDGSDSLYIDQERIKEKNTTNVVGTGVPAKAPADKPKPKRESKKYTNGDTGLSTSDFYNVLNPVVPENAFIISGHRKAVMNQVSKRLAETGMSLEQGSRFWEMFSDWRSGEFPVQPAAFYTLANEWLEMMSEDTVLAVRVVLLHQLREGLPKAKRLKASQRETLKNAGITDKCAFSAAIKRGMDRGYSLSNIEWMIDTAKKGFSKNGVSKNVNRNTGPSASDPNNPKWQQPAAGKQLSEEEREELQRRIAAANF